MKKYFIIIALSIIFIPVKAYTDVNLGIISAAKKQIKELKKEIEKTSNESPSINSLTVDSEVVVASGSSTITCSALDPEGDVLTYSWSSTSGSISGSGSEVIWTGPASMGTYTVTCTIFDNKGKTAQKSVDVDVATDICTGEEILITPSDSGNNASEMLNMQEGLMAKAVSLSDRDISTSDSAYKSNCFSSPFKIIRKIISVKRRHLVNDIYEYAIILKVGAGEFDKIGIYRVTKEWRPWIPRRSRKAVMMIHGSSSNFRTAFLMSTLSDKVDADQSVGVCLANNNIDVWGIDLRWALVPDETDSFSFMKEWNTRLYLQDLEVAVKIARFLRVLTGSGFGRIFMSGHSSGAALTYAYANAETRKHRYRRNLKGIIPIDMVYKFSPENDDLKEAAYERYTALKYLYEQQTYHSEEAKNLKAVCQLAKMAPDDSSPIIPGFTNEQVALFGLSATHATFAPLAPYVPLYHYMAGEFDPSGMIPTGLQFADLDYIFDITFAVPSYESLGGLIDIEALMSDAVEVPYDDYLHKIRIPVFYVGAAGGFGEHGIYTTTLLGSSDKSTLIVKLYPPEAMAVDYGHADLLWANNAKSLVWEPISKWIKSH